MVNYRTGNERWRMKLVAEYWTKDRKEVSDFAEDLIAGEKLVTMNAVVQFFAEPWFWHSEHEWWEEAGRPDSPEAWETYERDEERSDL
jgi:hypothetical protein